jgi:hypothetical protein
LHPVLLDLELFHTMVLKLTCKVLAFS